MIPIPIPFLFVGAAGGLLAFQLYRESKFEWLATPFGIRTAEFDANLEIAFKERLIGKRTPIGLRLTLLNKTDEELEVDWSRTLHLFNGMSNGHFVFDGNDLHKQIISQKAPDVIFPKLTATRILRPAANVKEIPIPSVGKFDVGRSHWIASGLKEGSHGIYLNVRCKDRILTESLIVNLTRQPLEKGLVKD